MPVRSTPSWARTAPERALASILAGREEYEVTEGSITFDGVDLELDATERAVAGIFLAFQYPVEIPGVSNINFLRTALNSIREQREEEPSPARTSSPR